MRDRAGKSDLGRITIHVYDINDNAPALHPLSFKADIFGRLFSFIF